MKNCQLLSVRVLWTVWHAIMFLSDFGDVIAWIMIFRRKFNSVHHFFWTCDVGIEVVWFVDSGDFFLTGLENQEWELALRIDLESCRRRSNIILTCSICWIRICFTDDCVVIHWEWERVCWSCWFIDLVEHWSPIHSVCFTIDFQLSIDIWRQEIHTGWQICLWNHSIFAGCLVIDTTKFPDQDARHPALPRNSLSNHRNLSISEFWNFLEDPDQNDWSDVLTSTSR
jgi:hypothetical protein